jgi:5-methylthioadenosine/S-adenosylhomocysteine deaminase
VMRGAFWLQKARLLDPSATPAHDVLHMATEGGAKALGIDRLGRLEPGWKADLQIVKLDLPTPIDPTTFADQLVLWRSGHHVRDVMVAGKWRVRNGEVLGIDVERSGARIREEASRLWGR